MKHTLKKDIDKILTDTSDIVKHFSGKKILLTGGNGFLGKYFVEIFKNYNVFLKKPLKLLVIDNSFKKNELSKDRNIKFVKADISKNIKINFQPNIIIHAAGIASPFYYRKKPMETLEVAIEGTKNCLKIAKRNNSKFIFFSSSEVYGNPDKKNIPTKENYNGNTSSTGPRACYDESKRYGETLVINYSKRFKFKSVIIRPFNNYGPGMKIRDKRLIPDLLENVINDRNLIIYSDGSPTRTFCYITDAIIGYLKAIKQSKYGNIYNIGSDKPEITVKELARRVLKLARKLLGYKGKIILKRNRDKNYLVDNPQRRCPNINKAKKELKFNPKIKLEKGLYKLLLHYVSSKL